MKNMKTFYENTILQNIDFDGYDVNPNDDFDKVQEVYKTFLSEYVHNNNKHLNEVYLFSEWLRGLPSVLTVPFYNFEILENAKKAGVLRIPTGKRAIEFEEDKFLKYYWTRLAQAFFTLKNNL